MTAEINIKIDKGIPMRGRGKWAALFRKMDFGDSFVVESDIDRQSALIGGRRIGLNVASRKVNGEGYRVWLVSKLKSSKP